MKDKKEAMYYERLDDGLRCLLCPHHCRIKQGKTGICRVRINIDDVLYTLNYKLVAAMAVDPIEKKPLFHFYPGSNIVSVGTYGCNFGCIFCQNYHLAHQYPATEEIEPDALTAIAVDAKKVNNIGMAYTYNEPTIWFEYVYECSKKIREAGMKNVLVTNGFIEKEPLQMILPYIDAMNIDLKAFNEEFYRKHCKGRLGPVKENIEFLADKCHIEVTTLLINGQNDGEDEIEALSRWLGEINPEIPLHLSRYHPAYKATWPSTPVETLTRARDIARQHLRFVYLGNVGEEDNNTRCLNCRGILVERSGYRTVMPGLKGQECVYCGSPAHYIKKDA